MQTTSYKRKPLLVEAVQVTEENIYEVAVWAAGTVFDGVKKHIEIDVIHPLHAKQRRASTGDWVLKSDQGFKIYADSAFKKSFEPTTSISQTFAPPLMFDGLGAIYDNVPNVL